MSPNLRRREYIPVVAPLLAVVGLVALDALTGLPRPTVVRAGFTVAAALLAGVLFVGSRSLSTPTSRIPGPVLTRVVVALAAGSVVATELLGSRLLTLAVVLPVGYVLIAAQLRAEPSVPSVLTQVMALFAAGGLAKYVTTGFYFGGTDTFAHVGAVGILIEAGYSTALPHGYDFYPVFHFLAGAGTFVTGLPAYDVIVLSGVVLFALAIPVVYLLGRSLLGSTRLGLCCAAVVPLLEFVHYHSLYFFPQALAVVLLFVGIEANSRLLEAADRSRFRRLSVFLVALAGVLVLTHHLTYVLFGLVLLAAIPAVVARRWLFGPGRLRYRWLFPGAVGATLLLAYWAFTPSTVIVGIVEISGGLLTDAVEVKTQTLFLYGIQFPADTIARAFEWLRTATGVYAVGLATLLLVGAYELLVNPDRYVRGFVPAVTGVFAAALLLPLRLPIPQLERLQLVVVLLAVIPLGVGIRRLVGADRRILAVGVIVLAATGGATVFTILSAGDIGSEVFLDEPDQQVEMSDAEYRSIRRLATFAEAYADTPIATDEITNRSFETTEYNDVGPRDRRKRIESVGLRPGGLNTSSRADYLVAREGWIDRVVPVGTGIRADTTRLFGVSGERFRAADARLDKVYSGGSTRVYHEEGGFEGVYNATRP